MNSGERSFDAFFRSDYVRLVLFLMLHGLTSEDARDVAQDANVEAFLNWDTIREPKAWVRQVALRLAERDRKRKGPAPMPFEEGLEPRGTASYSEPDPAILKDEQRLVLAALRQLPTTQCRVMAYIFDGFRPAEIAEILSIAEATVRSHRRHALMRLRVYVEENWDRAPWTEQEGGDE